MLTDTALRAGNIMTRDVATIDPDASVREAARIMAQRHISGLPVVTAAGKVVGIVSENDLLCWSNEPGEKQAWWLNMLAEGYDLAPNFMELLKVEREKVKNVMSQDVTTIEEDLPLAEVAKLIVAKSVKRLPVLKAGKLVGVVSRADLVRAVSGI